MELAISPEGLQVCEAYLSNGSDIARTAQALGLPKETVAAQIRKKEAKEYLNQMFLESGFMNRDKILDTMNELIEDKLTQMREDEMTSSADILDLMKAIMKFRQDELNAQIKMQEVKKETTNNIQVNNSYSSLMDTLTK